MNRLLLATTAVCSLFLAPSAFAATQTGAMTVSAAVTTACTLTSTALPFGEVALTGATPAQTVVDVTCTNGGPYNIGMDNGANARARP